MPVSVRQLPGQSTRGGVRVQFTPITARVKQFNDNAAIEAFDAVDGAILALYRRMTKYTKDSDPTPPDPGNYRRKQRIGRSWVYRRKYERTFNLKKGWKIKAAENKSGSIVVSLSNYVRYAQFVHSDTRQTWFHAKTGWETLQAAWRAVQKELRLVQTLKAILGPVRGK